MARCNCSGSSCSCVVVAGAGVEVSGAGSSGNPYVIEATGDLTTAFRVIDTPTLDLTLVGDGTSTDPISISGDVSMRFEDLLDVNDPEDGPGDGEVPVWVGDHWEFQAPPTTPPGAVTTGAGLVGDGSGANPLIAAASGIWGQGSMTGFPVDQTLGTPIYTVSDPAAGLGQLRARPMPIVRKAVNPFASYAANWRMPTGSYSPMWWQQGSRIGFLTYAQRITALAGSVSGDISNVAVGTFSTDIPLPFFNMHVQTISGGLVQLYLATNRQIILTCLAPNQSIPVNGILTIMGEYTANSGVVL